VKIEGVHHISIVVQDMDRAIGFFSGICEMEFEEFAWSVEQLGFRIAVSLDGLIELMAVVDPVKAANSPSPFKETAEFAAQGGEGPRRLHLKVSDTDQAAIDAERNGIKIDYIEELGPVGSIPHGFKKINFSGEDEITQRITLISNVPAKEAK
jgi:catechol 2,3-dioxygenase-like lactoylglutathione lyase family enzyme